MITYKILHNLAPQYLIQLVSIKPLSRYVLRSSDNGIFLSHPAGCSKATLGDRAFEYSAPHLWNKLPPHIRSAGSLDIFKSVLKTYLFKEAFLLIVHINILFLY